MSDIIEIREPVWNGAMKKRCLGVALFRFPTTGKVRVRCTHKRKDGSLSTPGIFSMDRDKAIKYPTQIVGGGVKVALLPIEDMEKESA